MPKLSDEAKDARRRHILEAARRCFGEFGYEGATVARLEQATGVSRGAIFNYFGSKDELFLALAGEDADRFMTLWAERGFDGLLRAMLDEDPAWLGVYFELGRRLRTDEAFRKRWENRAPEREREVEAVLAELQQRGELRDDVPLSSLARYMGIFTDGLAIRIASGAETDDAETIIRLAAEATRPARRDTRARRSA